MQEKQAPHRQLTMEELVQRIQQLTDRYESDVLTLRHAIHADPELSFKEFHTMERVVEALKAIGIPARCDIVGTGIVADIQGAAPGRTLLLRADMDALPITENNDLPFCSQNQGVMHACGHDVHTANLVGVARILNELKEHWNGTVRLVFQPAEESGGGGREMIKKGILDDFPIDASLALHTMTTLKPGHLSLGRENVTSFSDRFVIKVTGKSTHSAKPQEGVDAIAIAGQIIVALNGMLLKEIDPMEHATYSIGKIQGGTAPNIICDSVEMVGMMRNVGPVTREKLRVRMEEMVTDIARAYGGKAEYQFFEGYAGVYNNPKLTDFVAETIERYAATWLEGIDDEVEPASCLVREERPILGAEDYGFYTQRVPSCFYRVATGDNAPAHSKDFFVEEKYIKLCTRSLATLALRYLKEYTDDTAH